MSVSVRVWLTLLVSMFASVASAVEPLSASLVVSRSNDAENCPDRRSLQGIVERILDRPLADTASRADIQAAVAFTRGGGSYEATLQLDGAKSGERRLTDRGDTCAALAQAVGVTVAMLLDPSAPFPTEQDIAAAPASTNHPLQAFLAATSGPAFGFVGSPSLSAGPELSVDVGPYWTVQVGGQYVVGRSSLLDPGAVRVSLLIGRLRLCRSLTGTDIGFRLAACVEGAVGLLRGEGRGYPLSKEADMTWFGAGGGFQLTRVLGSRWLLGAGVDVLRPSRQQTFSIENRGPAYRSSAVSVLTEVKAGLRFW